MIDIFVTLIFDLLTLMHAERLSCTSPNLTNIQCIAVAQRALKVKAQGHAVIKYAAGVGLHIDRTVLVFSRASRRGATQVVTFLSVRDKKNVGKDRKGNAF